MPSSNKTLSFSITNITDYPQNEDSVASAMPRSDHGGGPPLKEWKERYTRRELSSGTQPPHHMKGLALLNSITPLKPICLDPLRLTTIGSILHLRHLTNSLEDDIFSYPFKAATRTTPG